MPALDDRSLQFTITVIHTLAIVILEKQPDYRIQQFLYVMFNILKTTNMIFIQIYQQSLLDPRL